MMMHDSALHLTEDELHDAADGTRGGEGSAPAGRVGRHLAHCARCRAEIDRIRELLALAASLPRSVEPPTDLWPDIRTRIRKRPAPAARGVAAIHSRWVALIRDGRWLAAAAVLLVIASSAITFLVMQPRMTAATSARDTAVQEPGGGAAPVVRTVSDEYDRLDRELLATLAAQRAKLSPETLARVDRNLAVIDAAIAEIRVALAEDPGNEALRQLLKASYGQKSALVRQVSAS